MCKLRFISFVLDTVCKKLSKKQKNGLNNCKNKYKNITMLIFTFIIRFSFIIITTTKIMYSINIYN